MNPLLKDIFALCAQIVKAANEKGIKIATAESCTGGLIGGAITAISGSSAVFKGGVIAYDNEVKHNLLGVPSDILTVHGAVSEETAKAMATGAREQLNTDIAVSVTGIAGPGGGSKDKPVGTVWIGLASGGTVSAKLYNFGEIGRNRVRDVTVLEALKLLDENIKAVK